MLLRTATLVCALYLSAASASPQSTYTATPMETEYADEHLYAASVRVFTARGWALRVTDKDAGIVSTDWMQAGYAPDVQILHAWRVVITDSTFSLFIDCEEIANNVRRPCPQGGARQDDWIAASGPLRSEIAAEAANLAGE